jgi:hypothetical protein
MSKEIDAIKKLYSEMSYYDRKTIREFVQNFEDQDFDKRSLITEESRQLLQKSFSVGPLSSNTCPVCGK